MPLMYDGKGTVRCGIGARRQVTPRALPAARDLHSLACDVSSAAAGQGARGDSARGRSGRSEQLPRPPLAVPRCVVQTAYAGDCGCSMLTDVFRVADSACGCSMPSAMVNGAQASPDDVVLTGLSGRLPESDNVEEFARHLFAGVDLVTADDRRWTPVWFKIEQRFNKAINEVKQIIVYYCWRRGAVTAARLLCAVRPHLSYTQTARRSPLANIADVFFKLGIVTAQFASTTRLGREQLVSCAFARCALTFLSPGAMQAQLSPFANNNLLVAIVCGDVIGVRHDRKKSHKIKTCARQTGKPQNAISAIAADVG
ncbi:hypothetical protein RR48_08421 [Papilio machaon]|uniref:Beta-ketoacyl synthase-like N-terminal domain-containing protein n=1 Tax=Papilio machaon TaxID=76193 RepID=A0A194QPE9_PAPMA|nr:hypothetical protein RR48_08421 [Papilio machaon]